MAAGKLGSCACKLWVVFFFALSYLLSFRCVGFFWVFFSFSLKNSSGFLVSFKNSSGFCFSLKKSSGSFLPLRVLLGLLPGKNSFEFSSRFGVLLGVYFSLPGKSFFFRCKARISRMQYFISRVTLPISEPCLDQFNWLISL